MENNYTGGITLPRFLGAGIWTCIVLGGSGDLVFGPGAIFAVLLIGLPWLLFLYSDKKSLVNTEPSDAVILMIGGSFLSVICALPVLVVYGLLKRLF